jgi:hypothetical protein
MAFKVYGTSGADGQQGVGTTKYVTLGGFNTKTEEKNPGSLTGRYRGSFEVENKFEPGKKKTLLAFDTEEGRVYLNGNVRLVMGMRDAEADFTKNHGVEPLGAICKVNYTGSEKLKNGNSVKKFEIAFDSEDQIDVEPLTGFLQKVDEETSEAPEVHAKQTVAAAVHLSTVTNKRAQIEALLNSRKASSN